jgi:hypothetical protein
VVGSAGQVKVVGVPASGDVDVGLGAVGGEVDATGGLGLGGALDGVAGEGVAVVDAGFDAPVASAVVVEERAGDGDGADVVEGDGDRVVAGLGCVVDGGDGTEGAVADVGPLIPGWVEAAVGGSGGVTRSPTEKRRSSVAMISSVSISPWTWRRR